MDKYFDLTVAVKTELERRMPGQFSFRFGPHDPRRPLMRSGVTIHRHEIPQNTFVFAVERPGIGIEYCAMFYTQAPWSDVDVRLPGTDRNAFESAYCPDASTVIDKILEWTFPLPREEPHPVVVAEERSRLQAIASARAHRLPAAELEPAFTLSHLPYSLPPTSLQCLEADLRDLLPDRVEWFFPREDDGRMPLDEPVILATYETTDTLGKDREVCLAAVSPKRRKDKAMRLELLPLIPINQRHRWDSARFLWNAQDKGISERSLVWEVADLPLELLSPEKRSINIPRLQEALKSGGDALAERAALSILLQDEGRLEEALALFGIEVGPYLHKVIGAEKVRLEICHPPMIPSWVSLCRQALRRCAPWLIRNSISIAAKAEQSWTKCSRGKKGIPSFRLFALPEQSHTRKVTLMIRALDRKLEKVQIELDGCGSNTRLPDCRWLRPIEIDFIRYGIDKGILL